MAVTTTPQLTPALFTKEAAPDFTDAARALNKGADVDVTFNKGLSLLHWASAIRKTTTAAELQLRLNIITFLLDHNANKEAIDEMGYTPLHAAVWTNHIAAVALLTKRGADVNAQIETKKLTPLHLAVQKRSKESLALLLAANAKIVPNFKGATPLHFAAWLDEEDLVEDLLQADPSIIDAQTEKGKTSALHIAVERAYEPVALLLIKGGANVNIKNAEGPISDKEERFAGVDSLREKGASPLHFAAAIGDEVNAAHLIKWGADVDAQTVDEFAPLHVAVLCNQRAMTTLLLNNEADPLLPDIHGRTPRELVAQTQNANGIRKSLQEAELRSYHVNASSSEGGSLDYSDSEGA